jgi:hypothetical protein
VKAQNDPFEPRWLFVPNDTTGNSKTRTWHPSRRSESPHLISTQLKGRDGGVGAIWYHGTERSRANAPSVNEKETPCVAAVASQSRRLNSLAALQGLRGICNQLRQAWRQAVLGWMEGCKLRAAALDARRCVMIERLTHDEIDNSMPATTRN